MHDAVTLSRLRHCCVTHLMRAKASRLSTKRSENIPPRRTHERAKPITSIEARTAWTWQWPYAQRASKATRRKVYTTGISQNLREKYDHRRHLRIFRSSHPVSWLSSTGYLRIRTSTGLELAWSRGSTRAPIMFCPHSDLEYFQTQRPNLWLGFEFRVRVDSLSLTRLSSVYCICIYL